LRTDFNFPSRRHLVTAAFFMATNGALDFLPFVAFSEVGIRPFALPARSRFAVPDESSAPTKKPPAALNAAGGG